MVFRLAFVCSFVFSFLASPLTRCWADGFAGQAAAEEMLLAMCPAFEPGAPVPPWEDVLDHRRV